jgi:hypothetical protein
MTHWVILSYLQFTANDDNASTVYQRWDTRDNTPDLGVCLSLSSQASYWKEKAKNVYLVM